jgi:hypothetical protein
MNANFHHFFYLNIKKKYSFIFYDLQIYFLFKPQSTPYFKYKKFINSSNFKYSNFLYLLMEFLFNLSFINY